MNKVIATLAVVLTLSASNAFAEDGNVTNLDDFGLSNMTVVSDAAGMEVRGMKARLRTSGFSDTFIVLTPNIGGQDSQQHSARTRVNHSGSRKAIGGSSESRTKLTLVLAKDTTAFGITFPKGTSSLRFNSSGSAKAWAK